MITLEQVSLLETRVSKVIETLKALRTENAGLQAENRRLQQQLEGYEKRVTELERLVQQFKEDQGKIEATILSALARLNQFEDVLEAELSKTSSSTEKKGGGAGIVSFSGNSFPQEGKKGDADRTSSTTLLPQGEGKGELISPPSRGTSEESYLSAKLPIDDKGQKRGSIDEIDAAVAAEEQAALKVTQQKMGSFSSSNELDIF
ncbi:MAG: cell division protein ZapB [Treponemataceae bacterium]|nr:cell division protein ZapB [Treponemataceae bacterium]